MIRRTEPFIVLLIVVAFVVAAILSHIVPARAFLLLSSPGGGGVPCGATQAIYSTACNAILSGDMEMPL